MPFNMNQKNPKKMEGQLETKNHLQTYLDMFIVFRCKGIFFTHRLPTSIDFDYEAWMI